MKKYVKYFLEFSEKELVELRKIFNMNSSMRAIDSKMNKCIFDSVETISNIEIRKRVKEEFSTVPFGKMFQIVNLVEN